MAYVVARRNGRFEVRESLHTPRGPRARTLAGFRVLTDDVLAEAGRRAERPFDAHAVIGSAGRAGAPLEGALASAGPAGARAEAAADGARSSSPSRFVEASRRMALTFGQPPATKSKDPGAVLIELLGFADAVTASQPPRPFEPLAFPPLGSLPRRAGRPGERRGAVSAGGT